MELCRDHVGRLAFGTEANNVTLRPAAVPVIAFCLSRSRLGPPETRVSWTISSLWPLLRQAERITFRR